MKLAHNLITSSRGPPHESRVGSWSYMFISGWRARKRRNDASHRIQSNGLESGSGSGSGSGSRGSNSIFGVASGGVTHHLGMEGINRTHNGAWAWILTWMWTWTWIGGMGVGVGMGMGMGMGSPLPKFNGSEVEFSFII